VALPGRVGVSHPGRRVWAATLGSSDAGTVGCLLVATRQRILGSHVRQYCLPTYPWCQVVFRAIGTIIGAVVVVALTALFPQSRDGFLVSLGLWCTVCGFFATVLRNFAGYASALAGYTAVIIFVGSVNHPTETFHIAVTRGTEICTGILAAGLVHSLTDLGEARQRLTHALSDTARSIAHGLARAISTSVETLESRLDRRELIRRVITLDTTIDEALGEASDLRSRARSLHGAVEGFFSALSAWRGIANHLGTMSAAARADADSMLQLVIDEATAIDWSGEASGARAACQEIERAVASMSALDVGAKILIDGVCRPRKGRQRASPGDGTRSTGAR
jgi:uncharacterized membrane protein YccC